MTLFVTKQKLFLKCRQNSYISLAFGQLLMFSNEIEPIVNTTEKGGLKEGDVRMEGLTEAVCINVIE